MSTPPMMLKANPNFVYAPGPRYEEKCLPEGLQTVTVELDFTTLVPLNQTTPDGSPAIIDLGWITLVQSYGQFQFSPNSGNNMRKLSQVKSILFSWCPQFGLPSPPYDPPAGTPAPVPYDFAAQYFAATLGIHCEETDQTFFVGEGANNQQNDVRVCGAFPIYSSGDATYTFVYDGVNNNTQSYTPPFTSIAGRGRFTFCNFEVPPYINYAQPSSE